jgi:serine/threonine-protein kinase
LVGQTIAHYRVEEKIGEGGMGEVYLAHDTKLNRDVALKILPQVFALDSQRMARFEREAQVLASLNHPHVAQIYGLEDSDDVHALVLELVEGETLAERLEKGPIPVEEALKIAIQITEGLEAAHEQGIIHRDLKPANIKITPDETVKILDFGLAKAMEGEAPVSDLSHSPTITHEATQAGVILGTAAYMSPEQARGKQVDKRSDVWAFGCVLFEMLTGRKAFAGDNITDVIASIVKEEPDWELLPTSISWRIRELLSRCIQKDPHERLRDIGDARIEIQHTSPEYPQVVDQHTSDSQTRRGLLVGAALIGLLAGLIAATVLLSLFWTGTTQSPSRQPMRVAILSPVWVSDWTLEIDVAISPQGDQVAFVGFENEEEFIYQRSLNRSEAIQIKGTEGGYQPFFSPDGNWLGFFADDKLKKVKLDGGAVEVLCEATNPFGAGWYPDGTIIFNNLPWEGLWRVPESGGIPERLTLPDYENYDNAHMRPSSLLPDGKNLIFSVWHGNGRYNVETLNLDTGERKVIIEDTAYAVYSPTGHLLFSESDGLYAVAFDPETLTIQGPRTPLIRDIWIGERTNLAQFALSENGTLVYRSGEDPKRVLVLVDMEGESTPLPAPPRRYSWPRFSPDGNSIAVTIQEGETTGVWIVDPATGSVRNLTLEGFNSWPIWTPDGKRIIYHSDRSGAGRWKLYWQPSDGGGPAELLFDARAEGYGGIGPNCTTADGQILVGGGNVKFDPDPLGGSAIVALKLGDPHELTEIVPRQPKVGKFNPILSPNGQWLAYVSEESGKTGGGWQVYLTSFPGPGPKRMISTVGGLRPIWSPNGRQLYFSNKGKMMAVDVLTEGDLGVSAPREMFDLDPFDWGDNYTRPNWDISPDGKHFLMTRWVEHPWKEEAKDVRTGGYHLNIITDFFSELKEKVPVE